MKFIIKREYLLKYLKKICNISKGKVILPILENMLIKTKKNLMYLIVTNLEVQIIAKIKLKGIKKTTSITISIKKILNIFKFLPLKSSIKIILKKKKVFLFSNKSKFILSTISHKKFPSFKKNINKINFNISQKKLKNILIKSKSFISTDNSKVNLNGLLFNVKKNKLSIVATDGFRLIISYFKINEMKFKYSIIIPKKNIIELLHLLEEIKNKVKIIINKSNIQFNINNDLIFISNLIESKFPNYKNILNKKREKEILIDNRILYEVCKRISILSNEFNNSIIFNIKNNILKIKCSSSNNEKAVEYIILKKYYKKIKLNFNVNFILDILSKLKNEKIKLIFNKISNGIKIVGSKNKFINYIIMPIKL